MSHKRLTTKMALLLSSAALFVVLTQGVAFAAHRVHLRPYYTCSLSCDGQPPTYLNCNNGAYEVSHGVAYLLNTGGRGSAYNVDGEVDLMYSPTCGTNWSHVTVLSTGPLTAVVFRPSTNTQEFSSSPAFTTAWDSPMVFAPSASAQACGSQVESPDDFGACTPAI